MKTKLFSLLVALCAISNLFAYDFKYGDLYYNILNDNEVEVTYEKEAECASCEPNGNYTGLKSVEIPSFVIYNGNTYNVVSIGPSTFRATSLTFIMIPNSVTKIGEAAFRHCWHIVSIDIPKSVTSIGWGAFSYCDSLTSIVIPDGVTSIEYSTFYSCSNLTSISIPNTVKSIGQEAFSFCSNLASITIPNGVQSIDSEAFSSCHSLSSITIPNSVTSIGKKAFYGCESLTSVTIGNSVTRIERETFYHCDTLSFVEIGTSVQYIGASAFSYCSKLTQLIVKPTIPPTLETYIDRITYYRVFDGTPIKTIGVPKASLDAYKSIHWGEGTTGDNTFYAYKVSVHVASADTVIGSVILSTQDTVMYAGESITIEAHQRLQYPFVSWSDGNTDNPRTWEVYDDTNLKAYFAQGLACGEAAQWQYASGTLSITDAGTMYDYAWDNVPWRLFRDSIQQVSIAEGITSIGACCLTGLSRLTNITLPNSITHIGDKALSGNDNLEVVVMGENIDTMGDSVFVNTPRIYQIVCKTQRVPTISENTFAGMNSRMPIYVLAACVNKYRVHEYWGRQNICSLSELTTYTVTATCDQQYGIVTGSGTYFEGESVTLTATPNSGYVFTRWSNGKTDNPYTFAASENITLTAQFTSSSTDVENTATTPDTTPRKVLRNGQVLIIENSKLYNLLGQEVSL